MKKFACPISMKVNQEQFDYLAKELIKLGYNEDSLKTNCRYFEDFPNIATNFSAISGDFGNVAVPHRRDRYFIDYYNPELFLALAAMVDDSKYHEFEWVKLLGRTDGGSFIDPVFTKDKLYQIEGAPDGWKMAKFRKATKEEIISHFTKFRPSYLLYNDIGVAFPEKWYVKGSSEFKQFLDESLIDHSNYDGNEENLYYYLELNKVTACINKPNNHIKVTVDQLRNHYLKQNKMEIKYKLIKPEYKAAVNDILFPYCLDALDIIFDSKCILKIKEAGVLHWFEEVKDEIVICGEKAILSGNRVKFGCTVISKDGLKSLNNALNLIRDISNKNGKNLSISSDKGIIVNGVIINIQFDKLLKYFEL